jgi:hypothetical protein
MGKKENNWQESGYILAYFGQTISLARKSYRAYVQEGIEKGKRKDLLGGGLIRSMGGWEEAKASHKGRERIKGDERILGDSDFVMEVLRTSGEQLKRKSQLKASGINLEKLTGRVAVLFGIESDKLLSPGKYKHIVDARSILCYWAVRELDISATDLAKKLRLTQPAVSISVKRGEKLAKEKGFVLAGE